MEQNISPPASSMLQDFMRRKINTILKITLPEQNDVVIKIMQLKGICSLDLVTDSMGQFRERLIPYQGIH